MNKYCRHFALCASAPAPHHPQGGLWVPIHPSNECFGAARPSSGRAPEPIWLTWRRRQEQHSVALDPDAQRVIEEQRARRLSRLATRDRVTTRRLPRALPRGRRLAGSAAARLSRSPSVLTVALLLAAYALAFRLDFEIGSGSAVPTQLILVPMLFLLPVGTRSAGGRGRHPARQRARVRARHDPARPRLRSARRRLVRGRAGSRARAGGRVGARSWPVAALHWPHSQPSSRSTYGSTAVRQWATLGVPPKTPAPGDGSVYVIDAGLAPVGLAVAFASSSVARQACARAAADRLLAVFARERRVRIDHELELRDAYRGTAFLLGDVVEADDAYTGTHSKDVVDLTLAVAGRARAVIPRAARRRVRRAAPRRRQGSRPERDHQQARAAHAGGAEDRRAAHGRGRADAAPGRRTAGEIGRIVRSCHERWDGKGYPDGIAGEQIPLIARIVAAATRTTR